MSAVLDKIRDHKMYFTDETTHDVPRELDIYQNVLTDDYKLSFFIDMERRVDPREMDPSLEDEYLKLPPVSKRGYILPRGTPKPKCLEVVEWLTESYRAAIKAKEESK